jgi:FAD binding domain-containing protein
MGTSTISELAGSFAGAVIAPGDPAYDDARQVWNGAIDRRPALIARCGGVPDVVAALRHARERDLLVAVRGGGHGVAGQAVCDDGLVIDLSPMRAIAVDPAARTARAQAGVLWGELDGATQEHGLATVGGIVTHTGIAGLTLGGGIGWLMRRHGATVDNLLSADLVTAEGELLRAGADEHPELFWGLRGGGGNFGIVTSFEYRLHAVGPTVLAGPIYYALEDAPEVLRFYRDYAAQAPDELTTILNLRQAPPLPFLPAELHGRPVLTVAVCYAGPIERGGQVLAPLRGCGRPLVDAIGPRPYVELQELFNPTVPHGWHYYWKSCELPPLQDGAIDTLVEHAARIASPRSYVIVFQLGGAVARVGEHDTAYGQRDAAAGRPRARRARALDARVLRRARALLHRPGLRQLPRRRGPGARARRLRPGALRAARGAQARPRPRQRLPPQPEHRSARPGLRPSHLNSAA